MLGRISACGSWTPSECNVANRFHVVGREYRYRPLGPKYTFPKYRYRRRPWRGEGQAPNSRYLGTAWYIQYGGTPAVKLGAISFASKPRGKRCRRAVLVPCRNSARGCETHLRCVLELQGRHVAVVFYRFLEHLEHRGGRLGGGPGGAHLDGNLGMGLRRPNTFAREKNARKAAKAFVTSRADGKSSNKPWLRDIYPRLSKRKRGQSLRAGTAVVTTSINLATKSDKIVNGSLT